MGAPTGYADVDGSEAYRWATGFLFIANQITLESGGQTLGTAPATFDPSGELKAIEVLALTMKFLGLPVGGGEDWVGETIQTAKAAGLLTDESEAKYLENPTAPIGTFVTFAFLDDQLHRPVLADGKVRGVERAPVP